MPVAEASQIRRAGGWSRRFRGGLAMVNSLTCMLFGSISGSAGAAVSSVGGTMIPEMNRKGYDRDFNIALTASATTTGMLIPPSNVILLAMGVFMDMTPAVLVFTPIFLPVAEGIGIGPVHFGIILIANLCIGLCTPPVGSCLSFGCSVGHSKNDRVSRAMVPFFVAMVAALALITWFSQLSLWLPCVFGAME